MMPPYYGWEVYIPIGTDFIGVTMAYTAYSVKLKKNVEIKDPELVTMKNGRKAIKGVAVEDPTQKVFRILSAADAEKAAKELG
tara:strand:+ start:759 stop:1007 length:249 start_codon:yes stop_codon:yes gene_type:complete